jgi:two-component system chemotaxis response regulator CheB
VSESARRLRVLVVDDSPAQRQVVCRLLSQDPSVEIAGWSANGQDAVRAAARLTPDVITLDDGAPGLAGQTGLSSLDVARQIMAETPTPIVLLTTATGAEAQERMQAALAAGIVAVESRLTLWCSTASADLVRLLKNMATVRLVRRRRGPLTDAPSVVAQGPEVVAIGASTGGPHALREIIGRLPACFQVPVLVVQHTTAGYSNNLVDWLRLGTRLPVRIAENGAPLDQGGVYIAPTERHLVVQGRHLTLLDEAPVSLHRPSATVLFRSVAAAFGSRAIGVLLTGMGDDGAVGLAEMREAGALTMAQDEATSVVFGMPAEAIRLGAAEHVLAPDRMPQLLLEQIARRPRSA